MTLYEIVYLLTPPIIMNGLRKLIHYISKLHKKNPSTLDQIIKTKEKMLIIGNGPSLKQTLEHNIDKFKDFDCIVVNHFCETKYYSQIKPNFYILADPAFFGNIDTYAGWLKTKINSFINSLVVNTKWDVNLIIPSIAINSIFLSKISKSSYIHPFIYNNNNLVDYNESNKDEKFRLWDKNIIAPPAQNCLNTSIWLSILLKYKEIFIIGADSNWPQLLMVDQETNEVYMNDIHFYGQKKIPVYKDTEGRIPIKLHEELFCEVNAFKSYWELKEYADYIGIKVFNASEYSLIDAFERKKLDS